MQFQPMHSTNEWYMTTGSFEHPPLGTVTWRASMHVSTLEETKGQFRPVVQLSSGLTASIDVRPPGFGHYATAEEAAAWCEAVVEQRHFGSILSTLVAEVTDLTLRFTASHPPQEEPDAHHNEGGD